jgi:hypothetical protein
MKDPINNLKKLNLTADFKPNLAKTLSNITKIYMTTSKKNKKELFQILKQNLLNKRDRLNPVPINSDYLSFDEAAKLTVFLTGYDVQVGQEQGWIRFSNTINCDDKTKLTVVMSDAIFYARSHDVIDSLVEVGYILEHTDPVTKKKRMLERPIEHMKQLYLTDRKNGFTDTEVKWSRLEEIKNTLNKIFE